MSEFSNALPLRHTAELIKALRNGQEVALIDLREAPDFASGHPLFAVSLPLSKLELEVLDAIPRRNTPVTLYDNGVRYNPLTGTRLIEVAYHRLKALGYVDIAVLAGDLDGWKEAGGEIFVGVNVPAKAFAAWSEYHGGPLLDAKQGRSRLAQRIDLPQLIKWQADNQHTLYLFDVRSVEEYQAGHLPGARHVAGEQLVEQTERYASVRGAKIVLLDNDGHRAAAVASRLAQQNWQVYALSFDSADDLFTEKGNGSVTFAPVPTIESVDGEQLQRWIAEGETGIVDLTLSANFRNRRIPGAVFTARSQLPLALSKQPEYKRWVVTCGSGALARYAVTEVEGLTGVSTYLLDGGTLKWIAEGRALEHGDSPYLPDPQDNTAHADEGPDAKGLVAQLERDNTHGFALDATD